MLLYLSVLNAKQIEAVFIDQLRRVFGIFEFVLKDQPDEISLCALDHRRILKSIGNRLDRRPEALEERHQSSSTRRNIGIVLDEILGRVVGCKFGVASFDHFSPPVENESEVLLFCGRHGSDLFPAGEMSRL